MNSMFFYYFVDFDYKKNFPKKYMNSFHFQKFMHRQTQTRTRQHNSTTVAFANSNI